MQQVVIIPAIRSDLLSDPLDNEDYQERCWSTLIISNDAWGPRSLQLLSPWGHSCRYRLAARIGANEKRRGGPADAQSDRACVSMTEENTPCDSGTPACRNPYAAVLRPPLADFRGVDPDVAVPIVPWSDPIGRGLPNSGNR
jgi:hypothetical protein